MKHNELRMPLATRDPRQAKADLDRFGLAVVEDALTSEEVAALLARTREQAQGERDAGIASLEEGGANQRIWNLVNKGQVYIDLLHKPIVRELMGHVLGGPVTLSSCTANIAGRGGEAMYLHADQGFAPNIVNIPLVANILWMLDDFTEDIGATRVVPGSHRAGHQPDPFGNHETVAATGRAGTALVFDGRLWHGTGKNVTDRLRHALLCYFARPFIRPQENATVSVADDVLDGASDWLREILGFRVYASLGGIQGPPVGEVLSSGYEAVVFESNGVRSVHHVGRYVERPKALVRELRPRA